MSRIAAHEDADFDHLDPEDNARLEIALIDMLIDLAAEGLPPEMFNRYFAILSESGLYSRDDRVLH